MPTRRALAALAWLATLAAAGLTLAEPARPNIVLILVDDAGFTDFGAYGSEIATPSIDALAQRGVRFSNFHASPMCAPSRAMLMTGADSHVVGVGNLPETIPLSFRGKPAYLGELGPDVVTIASRLGAVGYHTYMTGKWHLGGSPESLPNRRGFERSFALEATGADNWERKAYLPIYDDAPWFEDGAPVELSEDFYSSAFLIDKAIEYIDSQRGDGRPFFAYVAFQAIHIPVQAPREFVQKYDGVYDGGWDAQRESRRRGAVSRGLVPADAPMGPMPKGVPDWSSLAPDEQRLRAKSMAVNAGMLEAMDHHLGRLVEHLRATGEYENTLFLVLSDNGPEAASPTDTRGFGLWLDHVGYSQDIERLGERGTYAFIGPGFASAAAAPFAYFKFYTGEGGLRVPLIVAGPGVRSGATTNALTFITDVAATLLRVAGADGGGEHAGRKVVAVSGRDLAPVLGGDAPEIHPSDAPIGIEAAGNAALYRGGLKLVRNLPPFGDGQWRLHDLAVDPGETRDLAEARPEKFAALMADYRAYADRVGALEVPEGYNPAKQLVINRLHDLALRRAPALAAIALVFVGAIAWLVRRAQRRRARLATR